MSNNWNHLTVRKQMNYNSFDNEVTDKPFIYKSFIYKRDLTINDH